jgi:hypothetical protein
MANDDTRLSREALSVVRTKGLLWLGGSGCSFGGLSLAVLSRTATSVLLVSVVTGFWLWHLVHLHLRYRDHLPGETFAVDLAVVATTAGAGYCVLATPKAVVVAVVGAAMVAGMGVATGATIVAAQDEPSLKTGTEWVRRRPIVKRLKRWLGPHRRLIARPVFALLRAMRPTRHAGCFVTTLLLGTSAVTAAAVTNVPAIHHVLPLPGRPWGEPAKAGRSEQQQEDPKDYDTICHGLPEPGEGAPRPQASTLRALWLGGEDAVGNDVDGVGAGVGGCADTAVSSSAQAATWAQVGYCRGNVRSVGMALPDGTAVIMLGQVAVFAAKMLHDGKLLGASPRVTVRHGDLQIVHTTEGSYAFVRDHVSDGKLPSNITSPPCAKATDRDVRYTIVTPGAMASWAATANATWTWPRLASVRPVGRFEFRDDGGNVAAVATCTGIMDCEDDQGVVGTRTNSRAASAELVQLARVA